MHFNSLRIVFVVRVVLPSRAKNVEIASWQCAICISIQFVSMSNALLHEFPVSKFDNFMHFLALAVMFLLNN